MAAVSWLTVEITVATKVGGAGTQSGSIPLEPAKNRQLDC